MLSVKSCDVSGDVVTVHVECLGTICHTIGEKHARRFSHVLDKTSTNISKILVAPQRNK